jgi:hypothetical protein
MTKVALDCLCSWVNSISSEMWRRHFFTWLPARVGCKSLKDVCKQTVWGMWTELGGGTESVGYPYGIFVTRRLRDGKFVIWNTSYGVNAVTKDQAKAEKFALHRFNGFMV